MGVALEKALAFQGKKIDGQFLFTRDKTVYINQYYFYIDDAYSRSEGESVGAEVS